MVPPPPAKEKDPKIRFRFNETGTEVKPKKITYFFAQSGVLDMIMEFDPSEVVDFLHFRIHAHDVVIKPKEIITGIMAGMVVFLVSSYSSL